MVSKGKWEVVGPDPKGTNPNTGQWEIQCGGINVAANFSYDDAVHVCELHNNFNGCTP